MRPGAPFGRSSAAGLGLAGISLAALADQSVKLVDPQSVPWITWVWVLGLSLSGWFASCAPNLASWADADSKLLKRLTVLQSIVVSIMSGFVAYLIALYSGMPNLIAFIGVLLAAYSGDKYLRPLAERMSSGRAPTGGS